MQHSGLQRVNTGRRRDPAADVARLASHGATVLIGTPGRLADVVARTRGNAAALDLRRLEVPSRRSFQHI